MIPISDDNPTLHAPVMTWVILGAIWAVWFLVQGAGLDTVTLVTSVCNLGLVPGEITGAAPLGYEVPLGRGLACVVDNNSINIFTPFTSMFLHGDWGHIIGNSLFFWVFGNNIEDSMGAAKFVLFYLLCGLAAAALHVFLQPASPIPTVGASGAISGIMGAYLVLYPRVRVNMLFIIIFFIRVIPIPAWMVLIWWFALQVISGLPDLVNGAAGMSGGVAVWAHVGGFVAGVATVRLFQDRHRIAERARIRHRLHPEHP